VLKSTKQPLATRRDTRRSRAGMTGGWQKPQLRALVALEPQVGTLVRRTVDALVGLDVPPRGVGLEPWNRTDYSS
jgi:hypothetical protein